MQKYIVTKISEQDYGCEELPEGEKYCVDVILKSIYDNKEIKLSIPDEFLYKNNIDVGTTVNYNGKEIFK